MRHRVMRAAGALLAGILGWFAPSLLRAAGPEIKWSAPEACPDEAEFVSTVERLLGGSLKGEDRPTLVANVEVTRTSGQFQLVMRTAAAEGAGERRLADTDCALLSDAAALIVALAIDPVAVLQEGEQTGAVQVQPPPPDEAPEPAPAEPPPGHMRIALRLVGGGSYGALPGFGPGLGGAFGLVWPRVRIELLGQYWFRREDRYDDPDFLGIGGDLRLGTAALRACPTPRVKKVEFPLCAGVEVGAITGTGVGVARPRTRRAVWAAVQAGPAVAWWPSQFLGLWLEIDGFVPFTRPAFDVDGGPGTLHRSQVAGVRGLIGAEVRFR